ncbi:unnamed protein product, partial [Mesorhabditis belari]|uniref:Uncharacterized protein n=1 Tax=Mesorhabditis belari TaxID=2138241 RepID=A0AAF3EUQ7_9BILA
MSWKNPYNGPGGPYFEPDDRESRHKNGVEWRREPDTGESWTSTSWRNNMDMHRYHGDPSLAPIQPNMRHYEMMEERPRFYGESSDYHRHYGVQESRGWQREERHRGYERRDEWRRSVDRNRGEERSDRRRVEQRRERDDRKSERADRRPESDDRKNEKEENKQPETAEENVQEKTERTTESSTVDEAEQAEILQQQEAPDEDSYSEGMKGAADLVILKPNFDDVHFYGGNRGRGGIRGDGPPRGRGGYRGSFPRAGIDERSPSWVSQYFDRVHKSKTLLPAPPQRLPPPGPSSSHFYPEDHFPRSGPPRAHDMPSFGGGMREIPKTKADFLESSASRRMKEWERFKSENGDDPHQFIETLSDVDEKETWYQILDLVGPTGDDDKKMPTMPPIQAPETPKRGLLGAHPAKSRLRTPSPVRPSFFRHEFPSVRPGLYTGKDGTMTAMGVSRSAPPSASAPHRKGLLGQGPGKSNGMRNYERGRPSFNPYTDALPERYGGEKSLNGPIQSEGPAYEPNLPSQFELLERNSLLEAQLRALQSMQEEREMRSGHLQSPHQFDGTNTPAYGYLPDGSPTH